MSASLSILSIGAVTPIGRNLEQIHRTLIARTPALRYTQEPDRSAQNPGLCRTSDPASDVLRVDNALLALDPSLGAQMRRADRLTKMAVAAATDAWRAAKITDVPPERIGLFFASGFGPHSRGFKFLDGILDMGDTAASPTDFSHSVHGAPAAYISQILDLRGPSLNSTDFEIGFEESLRVAQCWLNDGACDRVLLGAVEELGEVYLACAMRMLGDAPGIVPSEGAVFLVLARNDVPGIARINTDAQPKFVDLLVFEDPVAVPATRITNPIPARRTVSFTTAFGHSASASAFNVLGALLAMQADSTIDTAATMRTSSEGRTVTLLLEKPHA